MAEESRLIISIDARNAERNARELSRELQNITNSGNSADRQVNALGSSLRSLAGYMAGIVTVGAAINKVDLYIGLQNRLKLVTDSQAELNTAMSDTFSIAQNTASSWDSVAMVYQRFADNADRLNITMAQTAALTETVSKAISVSGGSAASAEAALVQFGQALASGVLRGEEFNSIAEQAPGLLKAIAFGLDTNVGSLRAMAAEGKITGDVLVESLSKAQPYIDDLFNKTDFTIAQSFTKLSNEITKFVGEAGTGSGAATALSDSIGFLANNLSTIADIAVVGGVALLTKAILTQTVSIYGSITASAARRAADLASLESQARLAGLEVSRTRQVVALALTEVNLARLERNSAVTRAERSAATIRLTQAEIALALAEKQKTAATIADTAAQNANNAARSRGAMLLGLVGGPIGAITIGVAALAAGYMYLKSRTAEATEKLAEQAKVAEKTNEELLKLTGNDKKSAIVDLTATFKSQNAELAKSKEAVDAVLFAIRASSVENEKARKVTEDARNGTISYTKAVELLNKMDISPELYNQLKKTALQYDENSNKAINSQKKLSILGFEFTLSGNKAQDSENKIRGNTDALDKNKTAAQKAAEAQKSYADSLYGRDFNASFTKALLNAGKTEGETKALLESANYAREKGVKFTKEMAVEALRVYNLENNVQDILDKRNKSEKDRTKELEKQQKVLQLNSKVIENASKYNFSGLESKYGLPAGMLSAIHAIETGNTGKTNQVNQETGATGGFQFLESTAKQYNVRNRKDLAQSAEGAAKYMSYLLSLFKGDLEKAVRAYHAGEGNVQKNKNIGKYNNDYWSKFKGYTAGANGFSGSNIGSKEFEKMLEDAARLYEQQAQSRKAIELDVADKIKRINLELQQKKEDIEKANFSTERKKEIIAEYESRAASDIAIANQALKTKLDDYSAFNKSEEALLKDSFDQKKFYASQDIELSKDQKTQAINLLDQQYKQEAAYLELSKRQREFQAREQFIDETTRINERYVLEQAEIFKINDVKERAFMLEMSRLRKQEEQTKRLQDAQNNFARTKAQNDGTGGYLAISDTQNEQTTQSQSLFDAEMAGIDPNAGIQEIAAQREAIWQEHQDRMTNIEKAANMARLDLNLSYGEQISGSIASMFKQQGDDQNKYYKAAFTIEKAFAIARSAIAIQTGIAQAANNPFPLNLAAMAAVAAQTASIISNIQSIHTEGFQSGGYTGSGGVSDVAGVVHGQEYVLNAAATKRVGVGTLDAINSGASMGGEISVNIQNYGTSKQFDVQQIDANTVRIIARDEAEKVVTGQLSSPNSPISKGIKNNFNTSNRRG